MKAIRNVVIVGLLAATPLAFAHREGAGGKGEGCQGMQSSEGMQQRHAERHARMAGMHQGMQGQGMGMHRGHRHGEAQPAEKAK